MCDIVSLSCIRWILSQITASILWEKGFALEDWTYICRIHQSDGKDFDELINPTVKYVLNMRGLQYQEYHDEKLRNMTCEIVN